MTAYLRSITKLSAVDANNFKKRISDWGSHSRYGQRICRNLFIEHFLPDDKLSGLMLHIANDPVVSWELFDYNYQQYCYRNTLLGGPFHVPKRPLLFGTAVEYEVFLKHLKDNYPNEVGYDGNDAVVKDFISRLCSGNLSKILAPIIRLKKFSIWSTWNIVDESGQPFDYCKTNLADEVRANMGLRREDAENSPGLLLFAYTVPAHIEPQRPTIADAELSQYFEPPPPYFEDHGWTVNWPHEQRMSNYEMAQRPECIHSSITLAEVKLPIQMRL